MRLDGAAASVGGIEILQVPDCPLAARVVALVDTCQVSIGAYPSPTLVVDGRDVTTGRPVTGASRCRLDLPTEEQVLHAFVARLSATD